MRSIVEAQVFQLLFFEEDGYKVAWCLGIFVFKWEIVIDKAKYLFLGAFLSFLLDFLLG